MVRTSGNPRPQTRQIDHRGCRERRNRRTSNYRGGEPQPVTSQPKRGGGTPCIAYVRDHACSRMVSLTYSPSSWRTSPPTSVHMCVAADHRRACRLQHAVALVADSSGGKFATLAAAAELADWDCATSVHRIRRRLMVSLLPRSRDADGACTSSTHHQRLRIQTRTHYRPIQHRVQGKRRSARWSAPMDRGLIRAGLRRRPEPATPRLHQYRLSPVVGVQPERAAKLIGDTTAGTLQRFRGHRCSDLAAPDDSRPRPRATSYAAPRRCSAPAGAVPLLELGLPDTVVEISYNRLAALRKPDAE